MTSMAYTSRGDSTPKTALEPGQYPGVFVTPITDSTLPDRFIKDPAKDDGVRAQWTFEIIDPGGKGDGEQVTTLTSTYLSVDEKGDPKSGAAKLCVALNGGKAPWGSRDAMRAFDWESLSGRAVLLDVDVSDTGYAKVKQFSALPKVMWPMVKGRATVPGSSPAKADRRSLEDANAALADSEEDGVPF